MTTRPGRRANSGLFLVATRPRPRAASGLFLAATRPRPRADGGLFLVATRSHARAGSGQFLVATAILLGASRTAWALCPNCLGQNATLSPTMRIVGVFLLIPPAVFFVVARIVRRLSR